ncbi:restriction endonuclease [Sphingopyxis sp. LC363]|uniref:restriction endonuclease n=1 Tax=Sphingopyxis sp. LC363 TaxID=1120705 RepID=UPI00126A1D46|nr:restriction endonuclease [Sphingopyxis sp. LC363]
MKSKAIQSGMIQDLNDAFMFIPGIGPDKVSDITANIIRKHLITYTQNQFALYGVDIPNKYPTGLMWDSLNRCWHEEHDYIPFYKGQKVLLVPKWYVKYHYDFTKLGRRYYDGFIASFVRDRELSTMGKLVSFIPRKNSPPTPHVYKHDIEREIPRNKDSIVDFTQKHPDVYRKFRDAMLKHNPMSINALVNAQGKNFREMEFSNSSIEALRNIPTGNRSANDYQSLIVGLSHFLLYPSLTNPVLERPINDGRKRIDIAFDNSADKGVFHRLRTDPFLLAREVMIECKNYADDLENPEIDQLIGRFDNRRGRFGILVCRSITDKQKTEARCTDAFKAQQGVVVVLTDDDICEALAAGPLGRETRINEIVQNQLRSLLA